MSENYTKGGTSCSLAAGLDGGRSDVFQAGLYGAQQYGVAYLSGAAVTGFLALFGAVLGVL